MNTFPHATEPVSESPSDAPAHCSSPASCPLSHIRAGMSVRIKHLTAPDDVSLRLREIGFVENQVIKLLMYQTNLICQVCNARLALSAQLAQMIIVEPATSSYAFQFLPKEPL